MAIHVERDLRKALSTTDNVLIAGARQTFVPVALTSGTVLGYRSSGNAPAAITIAQLLSDLGISPSVDNVMLASSAAGTWGELSVAASRIVGRASTGNIAALTAAQPLAVLGLDPSAADQVPVSTAASTYGFVTLASSQFLGRKSTGATTNLAAADARTILGLEPSAAEQVAVSTAASTWGLITLAASQFLGRKSSGSATNLTATDVWDILNAGAVNRTLKVTTITASTYTVGATDHVLLVDPPTGGTTITMPAASTTGREIVVVNHTGDALTDNITINRAGTDTINGGTSTTINTNYGHRRFIADGGTRWTIIATA